MTSYIDHSGFRIDLALTETSILAKTDLTPPEYRFKVKNDSRIISELGSVLSEAFDAPIDDIICLDYTPKLNAIVVSNNEAFRIKEVKGDSLSCLHLPYVTEDLNRFASQLLLDQGIRCDSTNSFVYAKGFFNMDNDTPHCNPGNHPCGQICLPKNSQCRAGNRKKTSTVKKMTNKIKRTVKKTKEALKHGIVGGALTVAGLAYMSKGGSGGASASPAQPEPNPNPNLGGVAQSSPGSASGVSTQPHAPIPTPSGVPGTSPQPPSTTTQPTTTTGGNTAPTTAYSSVSSASFNTAMGNKTASAGKTSRTQGGIVAAPKLADDDVIDVEVKHTPQLPGRDFKELPGIPKTINEAKTQLKKSAMKKTKAATTNKGFKPNSMPLAPVASVDETIITGKGPSRSPMAVDEKSKRTKGLKVKQQSGATQRWSQRKKEQKEKKNNKHTPSFTDFI